MPAAPPATELLAPRPDGRVVERTRAVRLGDVDRRGRLRLDATARYLQDVATDDVADSSLDGAYTWVVRRTLVEVVTPAILDEPLTLTTFCSGTGRCWAERRTSIAGARGASVEAVSLWIRIDPAGGGPVSLGDDFMDVYGGAAAGRRVTARLRLPAEAGDAIVRPWQIRRVDIDPLSHVNNAAQWAGLEEICAEQRCGRRGVAEIEFLAPIERDAAVELRVARDVSPAGCSAWLVADRRTCTALRWTSAVSEV
jgi:acyl-ACP thioesterase